MLKSPIFYWITTGLVSALMLFSAFMYLTSEQMTAAFHHLGFPDYFRVELAIAKAMGVVALLAPIPARIKEWAYAGFGITFISAVIAHTCSGDPAPAILTPAVTLLVLVGSYLAYHRRIPA